MVDRQARDRRWYGMPGPRAASFTRRAKRGKLERPEARAPRSNRSTSRSRSARAPRRPSTALRRTGSTNAEARERAKLVAQARKQAVAALKGTGTHPSVIPDELWDDALDRMIDHGLEPLEALDAAYTKAEHEAIVAESEKSEQAAEEREAAGEKRTRLVGERKEAAQAVTAGGEAAQAEAAEAGEGGERAGAHQPPTGAEPPAAERQPVGVGERGHAVRQPAEPAERPERPAERPTEHTAAGQQHVLPGAERISDAELAKRRAGERLRPTVAQQAADEGLFGETHKQADLDRAGQEKAHIRNRECVQQAHGT